MQGEFSHLRKGLLPVSPTAAFFFARDFISKTGAAMPATKIHYTNNAKLKVFHIILKYGLIGCINLSPKLG